MTYGDGQPWEMGLPNLNLHRLTGLAGCAYEPGSAALRADVAIWPLHAVPGKSKLSPRVEVRDTRTWQVLRYVPLAGPVMGVTLSPDGQRFVAALRRGPVDMYDVRSGRLLWSLSMGATCISGSFSADGSKIIAVGLDGAARVYDVSGPKPRRLRLFREALTAAVGPSGHLAYVQGQGVIRKYSLDGPAEYRRVDLPPNVYYGYFADTVGRRFAAYDGSDNSVGGEHVFVIDMTNPATRIAKLQLGLPIQALADGAPWAMLLVNRGPVGASNRLRIIDWAARKTMMEYDGGNLAATILRVFPDRSKIAAIDGSEARILDVASQSVVATLDMPAAANRVAISSDGNNVAVADENGWLGLWHYAGEWQRRWLVRAHPGVVRSVNFSKNGNRIVTAGVDAHARVWTSATGRELSDLTGHTLMVEDADFSPDGTRIVTGADDDTVRIWDPVSGGELCTLGPLAARVFKVRFTPDGASLVAFTDSGTLMIWPTTDPHASAK
ncbi:MAG: WD40 repeat domain-containing protein [Fimbriimonadaceae bacterium]